MTTKQTEALKQAQSVLRGLTYKDSKITAALEAIHSALETLPTQDIPKERLALNVRHQDCHKAADAFWTYWNENGETHKGLTVERRVRPHWCRRKGEIAC